MKRYIYIVVILVGLLIVESCNKLPMNGSLDGMWQLKTIIKNSHEKDQQDEGICWSFQLKLCQITYTKGRFTGISNIINARFLHKADSLLISDIHLNFRNRDSLIVAPTIAIFEEAGITGSQEGFKIIMLNKESMLLENGNKKLLFRKLE